jgi:hypothetical protein
VRIEGEYPRNNKAPAFLQGLRLIWCRHQESNPGPTDYKSGQLLNRIKGWRLFLYVNNKASGLIFLLWRLAMYAPAITSFPLTETCV